MVFATVLLKPVDDQDPLAFTSTNADYENDDSGNDDTTENFIILEDPIEADSEIQDSEGSLYRWTPPSVLLLLETYKSMEKLLHSGTMPQKKVWERISIILKKKGYNVTGPQCSSKLRSLKKTFKSMKNHKGKSGNHRRPWQFFNLLEEIFTKNDWCDTVASSNGLSSHQTETSSSMEESDMECSSNKLTSKLNKATIATLLGELLKQKEAHKHNKMKRYEERMEMEEKFHRILKKFIGKKL